MPRGVRHKENGATQARRERVRVILARTAASRAELDGIIASIDMPDAAPTLADVERCYVLNVLSDAGGNISRAARVLGIYRSSLQRKLRKLGVEPAA